MPKSLLVLCLLAGLAASFSLNFDDFNLKSFVGDDAYYSFIKTQNPAKLYGAAATSFIKMAELLMEAVGVDENYQPSSPTSDYPFFGFIPPYVTEVTPGKSYYDTSSSCWKNSTFSLGKVVNGQVNLTITVSNELAIGCSDTYLVATISSAHISECLTKGSHVVTFNVSAYDDAENWDLNTNGVRVFRFITDVQGLTYSINMTAAIFAPLSTLPVDPDSAALNVRFLEDYTHHTYSPRAIQEVSLDESQINSGDFLGVIRLDGLDPTLAWAMGSVTGHTTVALRDENGVLHICESTIESSYWPTDGIQCTPYQQWLSLAKAAGYQVTHAPLSPTNAANFDAKAAWDYFKTVEGFEYGFYNQFWGWIDTTSSNFPCLPPDWSVCLLWQHVQIISGLMDKFDPSLADKFFKQSLNKRLGTTGLSIPQIYQEASRQGYNVTTLYDTIEYDSYSYNTTRYGQPAVGPSMVCCVFVCEIWKHGGLFGNLTDQLNCAEFTNWDDYGLHVFDDNYQKPPQCVSADPNTPTCQLEGAYTLIFNDYNSKTPVAHMAENCPSQNPDYYRPPNC